MVIKYVYNNYVSRSDLWFWDENYVSLKIMSDDSTAGLHAPCTWPLMLVVRLSWRKIVLTNQWQIFLSYWGTSWVKSFWFVTLLFFISIILDPNDCFDLQGFWPHVGPVLITQSIVFSMSCSWNIQILSIFTHSWGAQLRLYLLKCWPVGFNSIRFWELF